MLRIALVTPVYNETPETLERYLKVVAGWLREQENPNCYEVILVDDGSCSPLQHILPELRPWFAQIPTLTLLAFKRNFGQHAALACGLERCQADIAITLDVDLQYPLTQVPAFVAKVEEGALMVSGVRVQRPGIGFMQWFFSKGAALFIGFILGARLKDMTCPMNAVAAPLLGPHLASYHHKRKFLKALMVQLAGNQVAEVKISSAARVHGVSQYSFFGRLNLFFDFLANYATRLYQFIALVGSVLILLSLFGAFAYFVDHAFGVALMGERSQVVVILALIVGFFSLILGVLGDLTLRIYSELPKSALYELWRVSRWERGVLKASEVLDD